MPSSSCKGSFSALERNWHAWWRTVGHAATLGCSTRNTCELPMRTPSTHPDAIGMRAGLPPWKGPIAGRGGRPTGWLCRVSGLPAEQEPEQRGINSTYGSKSEVRRQPLHASVAAWTWEASKLQQEIRGLDRGRPVIKFLGS